LGGKPSTQGDVYSYGILLLEMFTGISPTDERFSNGLNLHKHVEVTFSAGVMEIIDAKLWTSDKEDENRFVLENSADCLVSVVQCGLLCSKEKAKERIGMNDVVNLLNSARTKLQK
jgi:serine/threonine protein kinase